MKGLIHPEGPEKNNLHCDEVWEDFRTLCIYFLVSWLISKNKNMTVHDNQAPYLNEPQHDKTNKMICVPSEDALSDQSSLSA